MVALEEGLLDLDAEVRDGFALRHLLSHCAGLPEAGLRWREPPGYPPGHAALVLERRLRPGGAGCSRARPGCPAPRICARPCSRRSAMDASLGLAEARCGAHGPRLAAGSLRRGRAVQLGALSRRRAAAGRRLRDRARLRRVPLLPARARWRRRPRAARARDRRGDARAAVRAAAGRGRRRGRVAGSLLGPRLRRARPARAALGGPVARSARRPATSAPRARSPGSTPSAGLGLVALANRGSYSGWWREPWAALGAAVTAAAAAA